MTSSNLSGAPNISVSSKRSFSNHQSESTVGEDSKLAEREQEEKLRSHAKHLTLRLYRNCYRSLKTIRHGNENDEQEFQERERKRQHGIENRDSRLSMLSALPPVNRKDELRSRFEYYQQYTREMIGQEADCLEELVSGKIERSGVDRYLHHLRQGEIQRSWLLKDMRFEDPVTAASLQEWEDSVRQWQELAREHCAGEAGNSNNEVLKGGVLGKYHDDGFWSSDDDDGWDSDSD